MSGYSTAESSRAPHVRNPAIYDTNVKVVKLPNVPRTYTTGGATAIAKGYYVYPKSGEIVFFYEDSAGTKRQLRDKNQVNEPQRSGFELVGTTTGQSVAGLSGNYIEVNWINSFVDHNLFKPDVKINNPRIGWVDASKVEIQAKYQSPEELQNGSSDLADIPPPTSGGGIDATTLGYGAIAVALILGTKKKKRK